MRAANAVIKPVIIEAAAKHTATIFFLHGLGDTGHGWAEELAALRPSYAKLICPTAPSSPVTINMGAKMPSWYDVRSLDKNNPDQDEEGIKSSAQSVIKMIQNEMKDYGIPENRILLGGFSQGAALSLYIGLTGPLNLGGIICMSGYTALSTMSWDDIKKPPILQCHGDSDTVVPMQFALQTSQKLQSLPKYTFKTYPGMAHSSCQEELSDVEDFIQACIPAL